MSSLSDKHIGPDNKFLTSWGPPKWEEICQTTLLDIMILNTTVFMGIIGEHLVLVHIMVW